MKKHKGLLAACLSGRQGRQGFSLIELLVVMFVITTISTIMVVNWRKNERKYILVRVAQEIVQNIRKVQTMALEGEKYNGVITENSYGLNFTTTRPNEYLIYDDKNGNDKYQPADNDVIIKTIPITDGVEIYSTYPGNQDVDITFSLPDGFTTLNPVNDGSVIITIRRTGLSCPDNCKNITINKTGKTTIE